MTSEEISRPTRLLIQLLGRECHRCSATCSAYEIVWNIALGFKEHPRCILCLGQGLGREPREIQEQLKDYIQRNECFRRAWQEARHLEGDASAEPAVKMVAEQIWDAGDMACGELVLALRTRLRAMPAGSEICVIATDPAATEDIPSWCRLTGHTLVEARHPRYLIRRKEA